MVRGTGEAVTPTRSPAQIAASSAQHTPYPASRTSSAQHTPLPGSSPSGVFRGGSQPAVPVDSGSGPTITTKPAVLDDLIRAGQELVPGHWLVQLLGRGGYGEVWKTRMSGNTHCALKIVRSLDAVQGKQEFKSLDLIRDLDHDRLIRLQAYWLLAYDGEVIPDERIGQPGAPKASAGRCHRSGRQEPAPTVARVLRTGSGRHPRPRAGPIRAAVGRSHRPPELS